MKALLAAEESLVQLLEYAPSGAEITIQIRRIVDQVVVKILVPGEAIDFFANGSLTDVLSASKLSEAEEASVRHMVLKAYNDRVKYRNRYHNNEVTITAKQTEFSQLFKVLTAVLLAALTGILLKALLPEATVAWLNTYVFSTVKELFLRLIQTLVGPIVFFSLASSIAGFSDVKEFGKIGLKVMGFYIMTSVIAIAIGTMVGLSFPASQSALLMQDASQAVLDVEASDISIYNTFVGIFPSNFVQPFVNADILQIMFLGIFVGIGATLTTGYEEKLRNALETCNALFLKLVSMVVRVMPLIVYCTIVSVVISMGQDMVSTLSRLLIACTLGIFIMFMMYGVLAAVIGRLNPITYYKKVWTVFVTGFVLTSSNATMPVSLDTCTNKLGIPTKLSSFSIPFGATINMDGDCVLYPILTIMLAHMYGVPVTASGLLSLAFTVLLLSMGTPGVPGAGLVAFTVVLKQMNMPMEALGIYLAIDPMLDMICTGLNVTGDVTGAAVVAKVERLMDMKIYNAS